MEILVIMLVAFIVLGPQRMVDAARMLGKAVREMRRMTEGLQDMVIEDEEGVATLSPVTKVTGPVSKQETSDVTTPADANGDSNDGPVAHLAVTDTEGEYDPDFDPDVRPPQDQT